MSHARTMNENLCVLALFLDCCAYIAMCKSEVITYNGRSGILVLELPLNSSVPA